ncbi:putative F-box/LRR-repeat protein at3g42770 [Phtheirospermum japonicum]|uniref:Putative F-box/LRR-repeat protein at3g42770 n=1 Tax=Phtheirospermum japonicum TaxID=374723 RepID=A0A830C047_9LAMI|nr:putative F-box/LRR-repeat protein at3g42770 [Phtheirospermum japonicum]
MKNWRHIWPLRSTKCEKAQQKTTSDDEDRISKLPDDILHQILSSVNTKQAVQTSVLSSRWRRLCYSMPNLSFDFELLLLQSRKGTPTWSSHNPEYMSRFTRFVTQFLSRRDNTSTIDRFRLASKDRSTDSIFVGKCIDYAIHHGARHLDIDVNCHPTPPLKYFPNSLFASEALQALKLKQYTNSIVVPKQPFVIMPNLKTLHLDSFEFRDDINDPYRFPTEPFSGFPSLEELTIRDCEVSGLIIRSSRLRALEISFSHPLYSRQAKIERILAPVLSSFRYEGYVSLVCPEMDLPSLEDVYFDVYAVLASPYTDDIKKKMPINLVRMLQQLGNAKLVTLTLHTIQVNQFDLWKLIKVIAMDLHLLKQSPSPFRRIKCLKLTEGRYRSLYPRMKTVPVTVIHYLTKGSIYGDSLVVEFPKGIS